MLTGVGAVRVPEHLRVVVGVLVDESGRDVLTRRVDDAIGVTIQLPDGGDDAVRHADIGDTGGRTGAIDHGAPADQQIKRRHCDLPNSWRPPAP